MVDAEDDVADFVADGIDDLFRGSGGIEVDERLVVGVQVAGVDGFGKTALFDVGGFADVDGGVITGEGLFRDENDVLSGVFGIEFFGDLRDLRRGETGVVHGDVELCEFTFVTCLCSIEIQIDDLSFRSRGNSLNAAVHGCHELCCHRLISL